jgi:hypothetical protein
LIISPLLVSHLHYISENLETNLCWLKIHSLISLLLLILSLTFLQNHSITVTITSDQWMERVLWMEMSMHEAIS